MEQEKSTTLKLIYIILLGGIFLLCRYFFIFEIGIPIYSLGVFTFIILGLYIEIEQNNMMCGVNTCLFMQAQKVIL